MALTVSSALMVVRNTNSYLYMHSLGITGAGGYTYFGDENRIGIVINLEIIIILSVPALNKSKSTWCFSFHCQDTFEERVDWQKVGHESD